MTCPYFSRIDDKNVCRMSDNFLSDEKVIECHSKYEECCNRMFILFKESNQRNSLDSDVQFLKGGLYGTISSY